MTKSEFVKQKLEPLLKECKLGIVKCEYKETTLEEFVTVTFESGWEITICVNYDSHWAILQDVVEGVRNAI